MPRTLIYLSSCALGADGKTDPFMMLEHPWLLSHFDHVRMVSYYGIRTLCKEDQDYVTACKPALAPLRAWLSVWFSRELWRELGRLKRDKLLTPVNALKVLLFAKRGRKMFYWTEWFLRKHGDKNTTLYSCWMSFDGYAAALSKRRHPSARFVVRGHAFDIDLERNPMNPYLMKQLIADEANGVYLISETAKEQYMAYMAGRVSESKVHVLGMGSGGAPVDSVREAPLFTQGVLRVVSCAKIIPIKQVHLMVEALSRWTGVPLCWTHIGGGEGESELRALAEEMLDRKDNVIYEITGFMDGAQVQHVYETRAFDVFINTSRKEGAPVSIMEAMRHGIPVIAPAVGGIPEMLKDNVGLLYAPERGAEGLLEALRRFAGFDREEVERMRESARTQWNERYCSQNLLPKLFPEAPRGPAHQDMASERI